jgi:hypothetical protein
METKKAGFEAQNRDIASILVVEIVIHTRRKRCLSKIH